MDRTDRQVVHPGDEVEVTGASDSGMFAPIIVASRVEVLGRRSMPVATALKFPDLESGRYDSRRVTLQGVVRSVSISESWGRNVLFVAMNLDGGTLTLRVHDLPDQDYSGMVDSLIRVTGVCGTIFNDKRQLTGVRLVVVSVRDVQVMRAAPTDPFSIPEVSVSDIFRFGSSSKTRHRIRISGLVSYLDKDSGQLYLQNSGESVVVQGQQGSALLPGARIEAVGFLESSESPVTLQDAIVRQIGKSPPPEPVDVAASQVITEKEGFKFAPYDGLLIRTRGQLVERIRRDNEQVWLMRDGDLLFRGSLIGPETEHVVNPAVGAQLRLTGVCRIENSRRHEPQSFSLLVGSGDDIKVIQAPWWSPRSSFWLAGALAVACMLMLVWILLTRRMLNELQSKTEVHQPLSAARYRKVGHILGTLAAGVAGLVLIGWLANIPILRSLGLGSQPMYPNSAVAILAAGCALRITGRNRPAMLKNALACATLLIAGLTLAEIIAGLNFHIDTLLILKDGVSGVHPARMAPVTGLELALLGVAILLQGLRRAASISQGLSVVAIFTCVLNLLGHLFGAGDKFSFGAHVGVADVTLVAILFLSSGILLVQADRGLMAVITSAGPGGKAARLLLPAAFLVPAVIGWVRWKAEFTYGLFGTSVGLTLFATSNILVFTLLVWANSALLNRSEAGREKMRYAATHDVLTNVMNRAGVEDMLRREMSRARRERIPISVLLVDVDHFKAVNDELGHDAGDAVLRELPRRVLDQLRAYDGVGRYGGEEFLVVLPGCQLQDCVTRAEKIRAAVAQQPFTVSGGLRTVTVSLGATVALPGVEIALDELLKQADLALYEAKHQGRNRIRAYAPGETVVPSSEIIVTV